MNRLAVVGILVATGVALFGIAFLLVQTGSGGGNQPLPLPSTTVAAPTLIPQTTLPSIAWTTPTPVYASCDDAWTNYHRANMHIGEPDYDARLDQDHDGIACER